MAVQNLSNDTTLSYLLRNQKKRSDSAQSAADSAQTAADAAQSAADAAQADLDLFKETFGKLVYPVGSIYMAVNSISPASLFGGTWAQIEDTFLLAAGQNHPAGDSGGEEEHTLSVNELPFHGHCVRFHNNAGTKGTAYYYNGGTKTDSTFAQAPGVTWKGKTFQAAQDGAGDQAGGADPVGGGAAHNNMPPYLAVYVWQRVE